MFSWTKDEITEEGEEEEEEEGEGAENIMYAT